MAYSWQLGYCINRPVKGNLLGMPCTPRQGFKGTLGSHEEPA